VHIKEIIHVLECYLTMVRMYGTYRNSDALDDRQSKAIQSAGWCHAEIERPHGVEPINWERLVIGVKDMFGPPPFDHELVPAFVQQTLASVPPNKQHLLLDLSHPLR